MTSADIPPSLAGYQLVEPLYSGSKTLVYRAIQILEGNQSRPVVLKFLQQEYPTSEQLLQFRNQYSIAKNLDIPGIVQPYGLESYHNSYCLVMEDTGGISLNQYIQHHVFSVSEGLAIALQLVDILHDLYQKQVIHKDLKPDNILIHLESKQIKLIDFSLASVLTHENQEIQSNRLEGTLAYIAPEQTGRMNRGIDYRADFYALGVTLFEVFTGQLPFFATDPMDWIHCHIAQQPPLACDQNPLIPRGLAQIIDKLMSKNAEDRYHNALGLKHDLQTCLESYQETGTIEAFALGMRDWNNRLLIPQKLYGRENEIQCLLRAFDRVANSASELMLIAGPSGIGKTAVVHEMHRAIANQRGYFTTVKFDQFNGNRPLSAFVQAFRDLIRQLLTESDHQLQIWEAKILSTLGDNAQIIVEIIPELERIIGPQPPAPELSGIADQNRFNLLIPKFLQVFATREHPLVIFLDDLQWADSASLSLIELIIITSQTEYLLLLATYRDHEISPEHSLMLTLERIQQSGATINQITLPNLSLSSINELVAEALLCSPSTTYSLTELVFAKSKGNPLFTAQLLNTLYQEKLITFSPSAGCWQYDIAKVQGVTLTDDAVELMTQQLQKLPSKTQHILQLAACIGNQFDLKTIAIISEKTESDAATVLWIALQAGLIVPKSRLHKLYLDQATTDPSIEPNKTITYQFLHNRVQQAAYSLITDTEQKLIHLKIGRLLLRQHLKTAPEESIFPIVNQLNIGRSLITQAAERSHLLQMNLTAAHNAKTSTAYDATKQYLKICIELLPDNSWHTASHLTRKVYELLAEVEYLSANYTQMEKLATIILTNTDSLIDKIPIYELRMRATKAQGQLQEVIQIGVQVLQLLGMDFSDQPTSVGTKKALSKTSLALQDFSISGLLDLPVMSDPIKLAIMRILTRMIPATYLSNPALLPGLICEQINLCMSAGNCERSAFSYANYGLMLCGIIGDLETGLQFGQLALKICDRFQTKAKVCRIYITVHGFISHWQEPLRSRLPFFLEAYHLGMEVGDLECMALSIQTYCTHAYFSGHELLPLAKEIESYRNFLQKLKQETTINFSAIQYQTILNLLGQSDNPCCLNGESCIEAEVLSNIQASNHRAALYNFYYNKAVLAYLFGQYQQASEYIILTKSYSNSVAGMFVTTLFSFYSVLISLKLYTEMTDPNKVLCLKNVLAELKKMKKWASYAPKNHLHKLHLMEAEYYRILGKKSEAIENYDLAIELSKKNKYIQDEALANELAAIFYLEWGKEKIAGVYMQEAYYFYECWGAKAKLQDLEKNYSRFLKSNLLKQKNIDLLNGISVFKNSTDTWVSNTTQDTYDFDLTSVIQTAQSLSSNLELGALIQKLSKVILRSSGAEIFVLALPVDDKPDLWYIYDSRQGDNFAARQVPKSLSSQDLPFKLIYQVCRLQEAVTSTHQPNFELLLENYFLKYQPQSFLCLPLLNQSQLQGAIYLENCHTADVFTIERQIIIQFLAAQAAITLYNARLYESVVQRSAAIEASLDGIAVLEDNRFIYINVSYAKMFGYTANELIGQNWQCLYSSEQVEDFHRNALPTLNKLGQWRGDAIALRKNGSTFDEEVTLVLMDNGQLICICRDITDQKSIEIDLREQEEQYRSIFETASDGLSIWELDNGTFITANPREYQIYGYSEIEYANLKPQDIIHPESLHKLSQGIATVREGQEFYCNGVIIRKDRTLLDVEVKGTLCFYNGKPHGLFITRDISDRKRAEAAVIQKTQELEQTLQILQSQEQQVRQQKERLEVANIELARASRLKDEFLATISHELRTPLNGILGMAEILLEEILGSLSEKQRKSVMTIEKSGSHLSNLINEILDVTRIESGQLEVDRTPVIIENLCLNSLSMIAPIAAKKNILLDSIIPPNLENILIDEKRMQQVLNNLLTNAVKFTHEGGKVFLNVEKDFEGQQLQFHIKDTGIGIPKEELERIFDRFVQVDGKLNRDQGGLGLGLAIAKRIVMLHQGSITVTSTVGQGSCFSVNLPYSFTH